MESFKTHEQRSLISASPKTWLDFALVLGGAVVIGIGIFLRTQSNWSLRLDIRTLNQGVAAFHAPPGVMLPAEDRPAEYPIERASAYWDKAASLACDPEIKSLAYYDLGTLIGREANAMSLGGTGQPRTDMAEGIRKLGEALRANPGNEDAKFNLELMERKSQIQSEKQGGPGEGYSPGAQQRGY
jgi:hypothetical protein